MLSRRNYWSIGSRKNDFFGPGPATGLPWASKPVFAAVSCGVPATPGAPGAGGAAEDDDAPGKNDEGENTDAAGAAFDVPGAPVAAGAAGAAVSLGGRSRGPLRPQPASPSAATTAAASASRYPPLIPAEAAPSLPSPACGGGLGRGRAPGAKNWVPACAGTSGILNRLSGFHIRRPRVKGHSSTTTV